MKKEQQDYLLEHVEYLWYVTACIASERVLHALGILPDFHPTVFNISILAFGTYLGGGLLIDFYEDWAQRRHIMRVARQIARLQGIDPKKIKYKNIASIEEDENGMTEVRIRYDDDEDKK